MKKLFYLSLLFLPIFLTSCLERRYYTKKQIFITCEDDTIIYYGGTLREYSAGADEVTLGNKDYREKIYKYE